jgi:[ribosomal protein S5]-alanine N-acetyltransferase
VPHRPGLRSGAEPTRPVTARAADLVTARLRIRRFAAADLEAFLAYQADPVVRRFLRGEAMTPDQARAYLDGQAVLDDRKPDAWHAFAVEHREAGRLIGDVGVWLASTEPTSGDIGFQFDAAHHGQGYAREAMKAYVPYLFETLALDRITAGCDVGIASSSRLLERLGMRRVAEDDESLQYALTRSAWQAAHDQRGHSDQNVC